MSITAEEKRKWLNNMNEFYEAIQLDGKADLEKKEVHRYKRIRGTIKAILADIEWRGRMEKRIEILRKYAKEIGKVEGIVIHSKKGREQIGKLMALADTIRDLDLEKP